MEAESNCSRHALYAARATSPSPSAARKSSISADEGCKALPFETYLIPLDASVPTRKSQIVPISSSSKDIGKSIWQRRAAQRKEDLRSRLGSLDNMLCVGLRICQFIFSE